MEKKYYFVKCEKNTNGRLYDIFKDETEENKIGILKMRYGILYLFPVIEDEIMWGVELDAWVFNDMDKNELNEEEQEKIFSECEIDLIEYFSEEDENDDDALCY